MDNYEFNFNHTPQEPENEQTAQPGTQPLNQSWQPPQDAQQVWQPQEPSRQAASVQAQPEEAPEAPQPPQEPVWRQPEPQPEPAAPYQYPYTFHQNAEPTPPSPPQTPRRKEKKQSWGWRIALIAIVCAISGGVVGGAVVGGIYRATDAGSSVQTAPQPGQSGSTVQQPETPKTPVVQTGSDSSLLTPAQVYANNVSAVVGIANESTSYNIFGQASETFNTGSGFLISADGEILTNYHVVEDATRLTVTLYDGSEYQATVLGYEADSDVALLKINGTDLPHVTLGNSEDLCVGDEVAAIGNPLGELTYSMTVGHVSSLERAVNTDSTPNNMMQIGTPINMMQIDAAINSGNSGGPLFNMYGQVVGITTAKYSGTTNSGSTIEGIGFAIPINDVMEILDELRETGTVSNRAYIGITVTSASGEVKGALVDQVVPGGSGEKAGLQAGDIITAVDGESVLVYSDLTRILRSYRGGDTAILTVYRNGQTLSLPIVFDSKDTASSTQPEATEPTEDSTEEPTEEGFDFPWDFFPGFGG